MPIYSFRTRLISVKQVFLLTLFGFVLGCLWKIWSHDGAVLADQNNDDLGLALERRTIHYDGVTDMNDQKLPYDEAVRAGNYFIALINAPPSCVYESRWQSYSDLESYGWTQKTNKPANIPEIYKTMWDDLGLSKTNVRQIEWKHSRRSEPNNKVYWPTGARYKNLYSPQMIVAEHNFGPDHMGSRQIPPVSGDDVVSLRQWSDITFLQFQEFCKGKTDCLQGIRGVLRSNVVSPKTRSLATEALGKGRGQLGKWEGKVSWKVTEPEAQALIASPNGQGVGWFIAQHKGQLGHKVITDVTVFSCTGNPGDASVNILFTFGPYQDQQGQVEQQNVARAEILPLSVNGTSGLNGTILRV